MAKKRIHAYVSGRVQGVFFRATTRDAALDLGLAGYVRNMADGSVEVVAEGDGRRVDELIAWCRRGPRHAHVENVAVTEEEPTGRDTSFRVTF